METLADFHKSHQSLTHGSTFAPTEQLTPPDLSRLDPETKKKLDSFKERYLSFLGIDLDQKIFFTKKSHTRDINIKVSILPEDASGDEFEYYIKPSDASSDRPGKLKMTFSVYSFCNGPRETFADLTDDDLFLAVVALYQLLFLDCHWMRYKRVESFISCPWNLSSEKHSQVIRIITDAYAGRPKPSIEKMMEPEDCLSLDNRLLEVRQLISAATIKRFLLRARTKKDRPVYHEKLRGFSGLKTLLYETSGLDSDQLNLVYLTQVLADSSLQSVNRLQLIGNGLFGDEIDSKQSVIRAITADFAESRITGSMRPCPFITEFTLSILPTAEILTGILEVFPNLQVLGITVDICAGAQLNVRISQELRFIGQVCKDRRIALEVTLAYGKPAGYPIAKYYKIGLQSYADFNQMTPFSSYMRLGAERPSFSDCAEQELQRWNEVLDFLHDQVIKVSLNMFVYVKPIMNQGLAALIVGLLQKNSAITMVELFVDSDEYGRKVPPVLHSNGKKQYPSLPYETGKFFFTLNRFLASEAGRRSVDVLFPARDSGYQRLHNLEVYLGASFREIFKSPLLKFRQGIKREICEAMVSSSGIIPLDITKIFWEKE